MIKKTTIAAVALLAFVAKAETCVPTNVVVAPLTDAHWTQGAPYNEYSPLNDKGANWAAGCVAIAAAQELLVWQWPWRFGAVHEASHIVAGSDNATIRFDGTVPFEWDALKGSYSSSDSLASRHAAARLALFCQSLVQMQFVSSGGEAKKGIDGTMEWYEYDDNVVPSSGDAAIERILSDLEFGSPLQVGVNVGGYGGHEVVGVGYGIGTNAIGETVRLLGLNMGWGGSVQWWNLASTSGSYIKSAKVGFRPIKSVQIEPVAPVSGNSVTLNWHLPNCYTNKISGFTVAKMRLSDSATTWTDDFSNSSGRTSNSKAMRVKDGALYAWDGTSSAIYTYDEKFMLTSNSKITYDIGSAYMSGMDARIEAKFEDGEWQTVHRFTINGGKGDGQYYNWGTMVTGLTANIGGYAGKIAQFRIAVEYTKGGVYYSSDANMKIDNLSLSDVLPYEEDGEPLEVSPGLRSATFSGLEPDVKYAFSVAPVMIDGSKAIMQRATTTIGSPTAMPEGIQISAVVNGIEMLQEGFYLECGSGTTTFTVTSANATELKALPSHLSILPDNAVSVSGNAGVFTVTIDGSKLSSRWEGAKTILTLKASNGDGAVAAKDMVLKFNRNAVMGAGTYTLTSDTNATAAVEFTGGTTIDGNGHTLTVKAGAFTGTGDVTLTNGTFIFEDLGDFGGTINVDTSAAVSFTGTSCPVLKGTGTITISANATLNDYSAWDGTVVVLSGTTVTVPSSGLGRTEVESGGTLKIVLSDEEEAYGYSTDRIANSGTLLFVNERGETLATNADSFAGNANFWTEATGTSTYAAAQRWSKGRIPEDDEHVIFKNTGGTTIYLDAPAEKTLRIAKVEGGANIEKMMFSDHPLAQYGYTYYTIHAEVFRNESPVNISSTLFQPYKLEPRANISLAANGMLNGLIDYVDATNYMQTADLKTSSKWRGTVVMTGSGNHITVDNLGNSLSFIRMNGNAGSLYFGDVSHVPIELVDPDDGIAFDWNDGYGGKTNFVEKIFGNGTLKVRGTSTSVSEKVVIRDSGEFFGNLELSAKTLVLGTAVPDATSSDGRLHLCSGYGATVESDKTWKIGGGVYLDGSQTLDVKGVIDTTQIFANAANPLLRLSDGGLIEVDTIPSASQRINASLYAGTFRIDGDATVSDGFCFSSTNNTYTTLDVNGHELTFGSNAISGHGVVYPTSSAENTKGRVAFQDMGSFTGDIIIDGTTVVEFPDDMSSFEGRIRLTGSEMATSAGYEGNVALSDGAVLTLSLSDGQVVSGYSTDKVTLDDSSTLAFADRNGNVLAVFTSADDTYTYVAPGQAETESLEETGAAVTTESQLAFKNATLAMLTSEALGGEFGGAWAGTADGTNVVFNNFNRTAEASGTITCQAQVADDGYVKGVLLTFTQSGGDVYVFMTGAKYVKGASLGDSIAGGNDASQNGEWQYAVSALSLKYLGPAPMAVWVAGEFDDDRSAHGGLEISLNGNVTNALGQIVIGNSTTLGATISLPAETHQKVTMLVKYSIAPGGAPAANSVPASMFSTYDLGALAAQGSSALDGYWLDGSTIKNGYAFSDPAQTIPQDGYILISTYADKDGAHGTAVYSGANVSTLAGGEKSGLRFTGDDHFITSVGVGGPTVAGAVPWAGMVIKSVAIFDEWVTPADLATYRFPEQGAVLPEDSDLYAIEPVAKWVNDFKTTEKNGCTLSVGGTTAAKDDSFGGVLAVGDAAAVIDVTSTNALTVLVKYRAAPDIQSAPVVTFGGQAAVTFDSGICTDTNVARQLSAYYSFIYGNSRRRGIYAVDGNPTLSSDGGYLVCARKINACLAYVGDSLDNMTGGECTTDMTLSNSTLRKIGIGGQTELSNNDANMVPFTGFVVEKVVVFNGYYTPDQIRYVENPEDGDTLSIASGATWNFAAGTTRTYTNIGTLSSGGTIAITNAATLAEGAYKLAEWTTPQIMSSGYGRVGTLTTDGLPNGLTAELVYGVKAIYLRVYDAAAYAARPKLKIMPYGDSITEGFNLGDSKANYRVLLGQKLSMLGYNVEMVGCYNKIQSRSGTDSFFDAIDPSGAVATNIWQWHSAKHGATLGVTALTSWQRSALTENVDTICAQAGRPDAVLLLGGINDLSPDFDAPATVFANWTNVVTRLVTNLPDSKIVVTTTLHAGPGRTDSLNSNADGFNTLVKNYINDMPAGWVGHVEFVDLCDAVKSAETGVISSDNLHPDWLGDDQMAEGWLSVISNVYPSVNGTFPSATPLPAVAASELGAAAKSELNEYRTGFKLCRTVTPTANIDTANPYSATGDGATENFEKVAYFVEYVRADNNAHKWVWVDMDAFGDADLSSVGLPSANRQQVVTKLHVKSNHNGIEDVAANDDTVEGWIEFSPYDYTGAASGVTGAPLRHGAATGNYTMFDWDDTLSASGSMGSMQLFRKAPSTGRPAQVLFAYNNWRSSTSEAEFGIGNFAQHFWGGAQTLDYTYTKGLPQMNASAYSVKRIEIWTKSEEPENPDERDLTADEIAGGKTLTRLNGKVYCGNDANRAVITNYLSQMEGTRPPTPPAPNTVDLLIVFDKPSAEYALGTGVTLEEFAARNVAKMNYILTRTDIDTNVWFRLAGVYPIEATAASPTDAMGKGQQSSAPGWEMVHAARERVGADVVISLYHGAEGMAYRCTPGGIKNGSEAAWAFCGVGHSDIDATRGWTWVHEVAHTASLYHNIAGAAGNNDPYYVGCGFGATIGGKWCSTVMNYEPTEDAFSSANHKLNGEIYSITNGAGAYLDASGVLSELLPYMASYRATVVPEGVVVKAVPLDEAIVASGATMTLSCNDPDATIWYYNASLGETEANAVEYSNPVTIEAGNALLGMAQYCVFAKKNGVKVTAADAIIDYKVAGGVYVPDNPADILDTPGLSWFVGDGWTKTTEQSCKGGSAYVCTPGSAATYSLKTTITVDTGKTLVFHHIDNLAAGASFVVWVDDVPMWYKKGANSTDGKWVTDSVFLAQGSHTIEFAFTGNGSTLYLDYLSVDRYTTTTDFPVPYPWIEACFPGISGQPDGMYETMAKMPGANGHPYWESYVLGLEPTNETSKFMATIRMDGTTPVVGYSPTNEVLKASGAIEYILQGKPAISNGWQDVEFDEPGDTNRFFRVKVTW